MRFDGTVTAGNVLTAGAMLLALAVWGVRLESRVDHETDLRTRLESSVVQTTRDLKDAQTISSTRLEKTISDEALRMRDSDADLKASLRRIETKFDTLAASPSPRGMLR